MISTQIVTVTPDMAREWLLKNTKNRKIRPKVIAKYARDMADGKWMLTHQGIAFDEKGTLVDGQHRLMAICKANVPIEMMVTKGFDPDAMMIVDTNAGRSLSDHIRWQTDEAWINCKSVQSTARFIYTDMMQINNNPTMQETIELLKEYENAMRFVYGVFNTYSKCRTAVQLTLALATAVCNIPIRVTFAFFDILNSNILPHDGTEYNVKAALDAKDWLKAATRTHRQDEAVLQRYFYMFYENRKRLPSDWGDKIIYPITKAGLDAFNKKVKQKAVDAACERAAQ